MLGTNDLKTEYNKSADEIAQAISGLVDDIREFAQTQSGAVPRIILVSPIEINSAAPRFAEFYTGYYDEKSMAESRKLSAAIAKLTQQKQCEYVDAATVAKAGEDGIHFSQESEAPLAKLLQDSILSLTAAN